MKNYIKPVLAIALVAATAIGGTLAYLSDTTAVVTNTFTVGDGVDIDLTEEVFATNDGDDVTESEEGKLEIIPAAEIAKNPTVTINKDNCYVYVSVKPENNTFNLEGNATDIILYDVDDANWKKIGKDCDADIYLLVDEHGNPLEATSPDVYNVLKDYKYGENTILGTDTMGTYDGTDNTTPVDGSVYVNPELTQSALAGISEDNYPKLVFQAYAVQSTNLAVSTNVAGLTTLFGTEFGTSFVAD